MDKLLPYLMSALSAAFSIYCFYQWKHNKKIFVEWTIFHKLARIRYSSYAISGVIISIISLLVATE